MAENLTIARPYAKAAFDSAVETKTLANWHTMLEALSIAYKDEFVRTFLKNTSSLDSAIEFFNKLLEGLIDDSGKNFIRILGENSRFEVLPEIFEEFERLSREYQKILTATVVSARPLSREDIEAIKAKLASKYGFEVSLSEKIDPSIIGGAVLQIGDNVIDASVKTSIQSLSSTLK